MESADLRRLWCMGPVWGRNPSVSPIRNPNVIISFRAAPHEEWIETTGSRRASALDTNHPVPSRVARLEPCRAAEGRLWPAAIGYLPRLVELKLASLQGGGQAGLYFLAMLSFTHVMCFNHSDMDSTGWPKKILKHSRKYSQKSSLHSGELPLLSYWVGSHLECGRLVLMM
jgi:hypothetical protein